MAENEPNPPVPPKPGEGAKVQPKKETVRITLPPKPSPTATIKLPTMPGGAPPAAGPAGAATAAPPTPGPAIAGRAPAPAAPAPGPGARPGTTSAARQPAAPAPAARPAPLVPIKRVSGLDVGLAIAAALVGVGAVVCLFLLLQLT